MLLIGSYSDSHCCHICDYFYVCGYTNGQDASGPPFEEVSAQIALPTMKVLVCKIYSFHGIAPIHFCKLPSVHMRSAIPRKADYAGRETNRGNLGIRDNHMLLGM